MFKKDVKESKLKVLKDEAIDAEDFSLAKQLIEIENEYDHKLLKERNEGLVIGFGAAIVCVVVGGVVTKIVVSKRTNN